MTNLDTKRKQMIDLVNEIADLETRDERESRQRHIALAQSGLATAKTQAQNNATRARTLLAQYHESLRMIGESLDALGPMAVEILALRDDGLSRIHQACATLIVAQHPEGSDDFWKRKLLNFEVQELGLTETPQGIWDIKLLSNDPDLDELGRLLGLRADRQSGRTVVSEKMFARRVMGAPI